MKATVVNNKFLVIAEMSIGEAAKIQRLLEGELEELESLESEAVKDDIYKVKGMIEALKNPRYLAEVSE